MQYTVPYLQLEFEEGRSTAKKVADFLKDRAHLEDSEPLWTSSLMIGKLAEAYLEAERARKAVLILVTVG